VASFNICIGAGFHPVQMLPHMLCTGSIPGTNESYEPVQMLVFLVVIVTVVTVAIRVTHRTTISVATGYCKQGYHPICCFH
jgi:hypothetical protein